MEIELIESRADLLDASPARAAVPAMTSDTASLTQAIITAAHDPAVQIEKMERLLAMHERITAKDAEKAFNDAMTRAQTSMGRISADAVNPQTRSQYATYAQLDRRLRPLYTANGFSLSFNTSPEAGEGYARVLCYVSHSAGHTRTYQCDMPADGKGAKGNDVMTKTHATGAAMSYGMRYLLKLIFNVAVGEEDNDGNVEGYTSADWINFAQKAKSADELQAIRRDGTAAFQRSKDTEGYAKFAAAVRAKGAELGAQHA
jgi:hypothetical protein